MKRAIKGREVISVSVGRTCLRGTYHRYDNDEGFRESSRTGLLLLNPGLQPRAGTGDAAVQWADTFAKAGYPTFRIDLPGFGDSDGDVPINPVQMLDWINSGGCALVVSGVVKQIVARFSLSGVVLLGLCASAVSAIYAAGLSKECRGLVVMDPYFFLPNERPKMLHGLTHWATLSRLGAFASDVLDGLRYMCLLIQGNRPPRNANIPLLRCWGQLTAREVPILVLKAPTPKVNGAKTRMGQFDYLGYLEKSSGRGGRTVVQFLEGATHSFADPMGRSRVPCYVGLWLNAHFPLNSGFAAEISDEFGMLSQCDVSEIAAAAKTGH